eukprot:1060-Heterococcus_DN1.PRE.2
MSVTGLTRHAQGMRSAAAGGNVFLAEAQAAMATGDNTKVTTTVRYLILLFVLCFEPTCKLHLHDYSVTTRAVSSLFPSVLLCAWPLSACTSCSLS